ncbi:hypothetical protein CYMTET_17906 [Cymbomonas tetramitiformis]|uniref:Apple domain-containing protein n=1 Tax=Cymbomonas tetramitiformis TaxID=36881 RepID=A0AAE0G9C1_9CHLO|nr:hypothetical protein CYMTET_17906 [Cymbomonas tetramitiformis]
MGFHHLDSNGHEKLPGWGGERHHGVDDTCTVINSTELAGEVVMWGSTNRVDTAEHCCSMCAKFEPPPGIQPCNVWVWCGDVVRCGGSYHTCWLKHPSAASGNVVASGAALLSTGSNQVLYHGASLEVMPGTDLESSPWTSGTLPSVTAETSAAIPWKGVAGRHDTVEEAGGGYPMAAMMPKRAHEVDAPSCWLKHQVLIAGSSSIHLPMLQ